MRWIVVAGLLAACTAPAPQPVHTLTKTPVIAPPPPAPITCGDVAVILRGKVTDDRNAGPMKEEAIAKACLHDKWSSDVIDCAGGTVNAKSCLDKLSPEQRAAYRERLARWNEAFPDEALDEEVIEDVPPDFVDCAKAIGDASQYAPAVSLKSEDRELATALRRTHILQLCEDWSTEARRCFEQVKAPAGIDPCRGRLEPTQRQDLIDRLAEDDALMAKVTAAKVPPCKKVVEVHYADAHWKGKLAALKPAEKKQVVAESRKRMLEACTADKWTASMRACIVVGGGEPCFVATGLSAHAWGFPPSSIPIKTGIPECDAYGDALRALAGCSQIPRQAAQTMLDAYQASASSFANMAAAQKAAAALNCKQADAAIRQSARSLGCTI